jgi:hypothetical protein
MATINPSTFATEYLAATEWLLDSISNPSAARWLQTRLHAVNAKDAAMGGMETTLASHLLADVMFAAQKMGYTGFGE